ncbi:unnamed protein product [Trifolium pratense]|uniref:Uncharacterized protein n=1 Tax=Trifolium pratense TaxID=57577 RepID=A0ACB0KB39_TRIPR|nr:unnamed protein product [Trifolium pratense]
MGHHLSTSNGTSMLSHTQVINSFVSSSQQHHHHHVGSAPSGLPFERHFGFFLKSSETSLMNNVGYSGMSVGNNEGNYMLNAAFPVMSVFLFEEICLIIVHQTSA